MAKRNYRDEIKLLKERGEFNNGISNSRLHDLKVGLEYFKTVDRKEVDELYKYLPIACIACIESFFRSTVQQLVDKGGTYFNNLSELLNQIIVKVDFEIISSLQTKQFTLGEFVSHLLPCNNIGNVNSNISKIIGRDFLEELKKHEPQIPGGGGIDEELQMKFNQKFGVILQSIDRLFELRHIFCHESSMSVQVDRIKFDEDLSNCEIFLDKASALIFSLIYENWGVSYHDQLELLEKKFEIKLAELDEKISEYRKQQIEYANDKKIFENQFDKTVRYWGEYAEAKATLKSTYPATYLWSRFAYYQDYIRSIDELLIDLNQ